MKDVSTLELVLNPRVQELLDYFAEVLKLRVTFYDVKYRILCRGLQMRNCEFCRKIQEECNLYSRCVEMDARMQSEVMRSGKELCYTCHAGLKEVVAPIYINGDLGGFLMLGQFRDTDQYPKEMLSLTEEFPEFRKFFYDLPCYPEKQLKGIIGLLRVLLDYISLCELASLKGSRLQYEIIKYLKKNWDAKITLKKLALYLNCSVSYISHELRSRYNITFTDLVTRERISKAEKEMTDNPQKSIAEIAAIAGFKDVYYFSRVYKKNRGVAPISFRKKMRMRK